MWGLLEALASLQPIIAWDIAPYPAQAANSQEYRALQEAASKTFPEATNLPLCVLIDQASVSALYVSL